MNENFRVQFIMNFMPPQYGPFQINYNTIKDKWNVTELQSLLIQEEARLKKQGNHFVNLVGKSGVKKKLEKKNQRGNKGPLKVNDSCQNPQRKKGRVSFL